MLPLTVGLAIEAKELWDEVQTCLDSLPVRVVMNQPGVEDVEIFLARIERMRPDVLLLDIRKHRDWMEVMIQRIKSTSVDPMIIVLNTSADPEPFLRALRAGAQEFAYPPLDPNLKKALERRTSERSGKQGGRPKGKMIGFLSAKGGCGSTTVACHTAVELSHLLSGKSALLADLDLDSGVISFLMKTKSSYSVLDAVNNLHRLDLSYWKALVSNGIPGLEIISAPGSSGFRQAPEPEQLANVLNFARFHYDWLIADLGHGLRQATASAMEQMDEAYVVTTLDVPALHQAKQIIKTLLESGYGRNRLRLVMNRMPPRPEVTPEELEKMLGLPFFAMLPNDYATVYESYAEGRLVSPGSMLGKHIGRFAAKIAGLPEEQNKKKFSIFR